MLMPTAVAAAATLEAEGRRVRVISMPCVDVFEVQDDDYRESVLPSAVTARVVVEAGVSASWRGYAGPAGTVLGLDRFGESAPAGQLMELFGFTAERVAGALRDVL